MTNSRFIGSLRRSKAKSKTSDSTRNRWREQYELSKKGDQEDEVDLRQWAWAAEGRSGIEPGSTIPDIQGDQKTQKMVKKKAIDKH